MDLADKAVALLAMNKKDALKEINAQQLSCWALKAKLRRLAISILNLFGYWDESMQNRAPFCGIIIWQWAVYN